MKNVQVANVLGSQLPACVLLLVLVGFDTLARKSFLTRLFGLSWNSKVDKEEPMADQAPWKISERLCFPDVVQRVDIFCCLYIS